MEKEITHTADINQSGYAKQDERCSGCSVRSLLEIEVPAIF